MQGEADEKARTARLRSWLLAAKCRLPPQDYAAFREKLSELHAKGSAAGPTQVCAPTLAGLMQLLWRAEFPEGAKARGAWLAAFEESLPLAWRPRWHEQVLASIPIGLDEVAPAADEAAPAKGAAPAAEEALNAADEAARAADAPRPLGGTGERGWLIERSRAFLDRALQQEPGHAAVAAAAPAGAKHVVSAQSSPGSKAKRRRCHAAPEAVAETTRKPEAPKPNKAPAAGPLIVEELAGLVEPLAPPPTALLGVSLPLCIFCRQLPVKPKVAALCGHFACSECWGRWIAMKFECPLCRCKVRPNNLIRLKGWGDS